MLDDLKYIHQRDANDALGLVAKQWQQLTHQFDDIKLNASNVKNIVVAGMGGSALAASLLKTWPTISLPFEIVRDYDNPTYVGRETLFIASSYSGNTEETLSALGEAEKKGAQICVIAAGGQLLTRAKDKNYAHFVIPSGLQPRMAVFYNFRALVQLLITSELVAKESLAELDEVANWLEQQLSNWLPDVPAAKNPAKQLAQELMGRSVVIYAGPKLFPAAYKWKINFNENAKNIAWCSQYPEFNHNEFLGWTSHPVDKPYAVVELHSSLENPRIQKRFEVSDRLLSGKRPSPEVVDVEGKTILQQLLWAITLGDFVSLYLALLNGLNPTPVDLIEKLKSDLQA